MVHRGSRHHGFHFATEGAPVCIARGFARRIRKVVFGSMEGAGFVKTRLQAPAGGAPGPRGSAATSLCAARCDGAAERRPANTLRPAETCAR